MEQNLSILRQVVPRIMTKYIKQYIVVKSQYVPHILQYIEIRFRRIVTALKCSSQCQHCECTYR